MTNSKSNHSAPSQNDPWFRKATPKDMFILLFSVTYIFASMITFDYYSPLVGLVMFGMFILIGIVGYFLTPKEKRKILRDFSTVSNEELIVITRGVYGMGVLSALCIAVIFGMTVGIMLAKKTFSIQSTHYVALVGIGALLAAAIYVPYWLFVKKLIPQLKARCISENRE